jgi:hypothetical protein
MACFACGEDFDTSVRALLRRYKDEFNLNGTARVYFKYKTKGDVHIMRAKPFFENVHKKLLTKKAVENGAEFALIQEFGEASNNKVLGDNKKQ